VQRPTLSGVERLGRLVTMLGQVHKHCFIIRPLDGVRVVYCKLFLRSCGQGEKTRERVCGDAVLDKGACPGTAVAMILL
jgi:hypothetical protein